MILVLVPPSTVQLVKEIIEIFLTFANVIMDFMIYLNLVMLLLTIANLLDQNAQNAQIMKPAHNV